MDGLQYHLPAIRESVQPDLSETSGSKTMPGTIVEYAHSEELSFSAAGCFCVFDEDILLIQRQKGKPFPLHWAIPTGKLDAFESPLEAAKRELFEEVGLDVEEERLTFLSDFYIDIGEVKFRYTSYLYILSRRPTINIKKDEVRSVRWVNFRHIGRRNFVPFFWDTLHDLNCRMSGQPRQMKLMPMPARRGR